VPHRDGIKELKIKVELFHDSEDAKSAENEIHKIKEDYRNDWSYFIQNTTANC
jgi:hypothetical protein